jgi:hypothetical protein
VTSASGELLSVSPSISSIAFTNASHFWAPQEFPLLGIDLGDDFDLAATEYQHLFWAVA